MYELDDYVAMVSDRLRTPAYLAAMAEVIRPGDRVLDLGTGFGFFAVHACRLGAAHVWAIEPNDAIGLGAAIAQANGVADRITFLQGWSTAITLPERADVLIEDLRGISPLHGARLAVLRDARDRLLVPSARRVPIADVFLAAPAEMPADLAEVASAAPDAIDGVVISPVRKRLRDAVHRTSAGPEVLLAPGLEWARLDLASLDVRDPEGSLAWRAERAGSLAGLLTWFRAVLTPAVEFETGPSVAKSVYGRAFLPSPRPVEVRTGDVIRARIRTRHDGTDFVWVWDLSVERDGLLVARERGSNLASRVLSASRRAVRSADHRPERTDEVELLATLARAVDGVTGLAGIAAELQRRHPARFRSAPEALRWAGDTLARLAEEPPR